jgi:hypothetical protein
LDDTPRTNYQQALHFLCFDTQVSSYWFSGELVGLAVDASRSLDLSDMHMESVPLVAEFGFAALETPAENVLASVPISAVLWGRTQAVPPGRADSVRVTQVFALWTDGETVTPIQIAQFVEGEVLHAQEDGARLFLALQFLAASPGVVGERLERPDRATVRRLARRGVTDPSDVRVIYLKGSRSDHACTGESNYHHRWIVSGHWRNQPYGPGNKLRRPVWVKPHVKGPEGAPMLTGEIVRAIT